MFCMESVAVAIDRKYEDLSASFSFIPEILFPHSKI